ncbi:MAG: hypothetical protein DMD77_20175 [Candidatus Rokuibacteriota bacterium]|nr:MAG: hypothetical protein DMD77_20175 [Candidatus Rokubacteria bacterium]
MAKELRTANIAVQVKAKKADGIQHPQMCGASTGTMNVYRINTSDWEKARVLGFVLYIEGISMAQSGLGLTDFKCGASGVGRGVVLLQFSS